MVDLEEIQDALEELANLDKQIQEHEHEIGEIENSAWAGKAMLQDLKEERRQKYRDIRKMMMHARKELKSDLSKLARFKTS